MKRIQRAARDALGFELRPPQLDAVEAVLDGRDTLVVMPTGSGKSAVYQVAGVLIDGPTVVVSPLIALQRDQVEALEEADAGEAAALNSSRPESERREALERFGVDEAGVRPPALVEPRQPYAPPPADDLALAFHGSGVPRPRVGKHP